MGEPPHYYVRDRSVPAFHHWDYLNERNDEALCGHGYVDPDGPFEIRPRAVCRACQSRLPEYHMKWWKEQFVAATGELADLRRKYSKLAEHSDNQRRQLATLQKSRHDAKQKPSKNAPRQKPPRQAQKPTSSIASRQRSTAVAEGRRNRGSPIVVRSRPAPEAAAKVKSRGQPDPEKVKKRVRELLTASPARNDGGGRVTRSYKPSTWRVGKSPSSYR